MLSLLLCSFRRCLQNGIQVNIKAIHANTHQCYRHSCRQRRRQQCRRCYWHDDRSWGEWAGCSAGTSPCKQASSQGTFHLEPPETPPSACCHLLHALGGQSTCTTHVHMHQSSGAVVHWALEDDGNNSVDNGIDNGSDNSDGQRTQKGL